MTPSEFLVGDVNNPNYVLHGQVTKNDFLTCPNSKIKTLTKYYYYLDGHFYSREFDTDDKDNIFDVTVTTSVNPDNQSELITSIVSDVPDLKVPLSVECEDEVKEIANYPIDDIPDIKRVKVGDFCSSGTLNFPQIREEYIGKYETVVSRITLDHTGNYFIINTHLVDNIGYYFSDSDEERELNRNKGHILKSVPVEVACSHTPIKKIVNSI